jgi:Immunity protein 70
VGLYLCVFAPGDRDEELEGVEVGSCDDFHGFRETIATRLEAGDWGSRFPIFMHRSDSTSTWTAMEAGQLEVELLSVADELSRLSRIELQGSSKAAAEEFSLVPQSLYECFLDVDGEPLVDRILDVVRASMLSDQPILFQ